MNDTIVRIFVAFLIMFFLLPILYLIYLRIKYNNAKIQDYENSEEYQKDEIRNLKKT